MPAPRQRRRSWPFYVALTLMFGSLPLAYVFFLDREPTPAPPLSAAVAPVQNAGELKMNEITGTVEIRHAEGTWSPAAKGDSLRRADSVRTSEGGSAVFGSESYEVKMEESSEVSVDELNESISRVMLENGMATAQVRSHGRHTFEVKARGSDAVASTRNGTFAISNNGLGTVAVGAHDGEVEFRGSGKVVIVHAGEESVVKPGLAPSAPVAIPTSLLLRVQWPTNKTVDKKQMVIAGQVEPGAVLHVGATRVQVDASGNFSQTVQLKEGRNNIDLRAHSVGRLSGRAQRTIDVDTSAPPVHFDKDFWHKKRP